MSLLLTFLSFLLVPSLAIGARHQIEEYGPRVEAHTEQEVQLGDMSQKAPYVQLAHS